MHRASTALVANERSRLGTEFSVHAALRCRRYFECAAMGYELTRFQGEVDEELVCPICAGVLEEPLQVRTVSVVDWQLTMRVLSAIFCYAPFFN